MGLRNWLYKAASLLGDVNAAKKGTYTRRVVHKTATRSASKLVNKAIRRLFK